MPTDLTMKEIPRYVANPLLAFVDYMDQNQRLLHLSMRGISGLRAIPNTIKVLKETDPEAYTGEEATRKEAEYKRQLDRANAEAEFARKEMDDDFPLLHAHALVGVWGALEATIEDAIVGVLLNESDLLGSDAFSKVRIPLVEFEVLDREERIRFLVEELGRGQGMGKKQGTEGFEAALNLVGLAGSVEPEVRKTIWEINYIRNVIVHRGSIADRRLVQACPWLNLKAGDRVKITHEMLHRYFEILHEYLMTIIRRLGSKHCVDIDGLIARSQTIQARG